MARGQRNPSQTVAERDWLLACALTAYEDGLCGNCGQPRTESMDPAHEYRYRADVPMRCHACTAISARVEEYADAKHARALYFDVELTPRAS